MSTATTVDVSAKTEEAQAHLDAHVRQMIEWHARATHGWDYDTWYDGRFLHQWADPRTAAGLREADAHYDADDVRRALFATTDLFRRRG